VDRVAGKSGFALAIQKAGWLTIDERGLTIPNFSRHNGDSAKKRCQKSERQSRWRNKKDLEASTIESTNAPTREEKRREENIKDKNILADKPAKTNNKKKLPDDFVLTDVLRDNAASYWLSKNRKDLSASEQWLKFINHHRSKGSKMADWDCAWVTWYTNAIEFTKPPGGNNYPDFSPTVKR